VNNPTATYEDEIGHIIKHIASIRKNAWAKWLTIIPIIEGNYSKITAQSICAQLERNQSISPIRCLNTYLHKGTNRRLVPFVWLKNDVKEEMAIMLNSYLATGCIFWINDFVSVCGKADPNATITEMKRQFIDYTKITIPKKEGSTADATSSSLCREFSIKFSGKQGGNRDDIVVALQFGVWLADIHKSTQVSRAPDGRGAFLVDL
jgi:hypothetical protein